MEKTKYCKPIWEEKWDVNEVLKNPAEDPRCNLQHFRAWEKHVPGSSAACWHSGADTQKLFSRDVNVVDGFLETRMFGHQCYEHAGSICGRGNDISG